MIKVGTDFSGIGAPEMALKYLGIEYESIFSCEIDKYARESYSQLHNTNIMYEDITKRNHKEVDELDLYVAGFPCQAFSIAGKRLGFEEARGTLFFNVAEFIKINQPKVFILENVKGLLSHNSGKTFQTIIDILSNGGGTINTQISFDMFDDGLGYHIYYKVLNTKDFGIPQNRERIFIIGFKDYREFSFPKPLELKLKLGDILQDNPKSFNLIDGFNSFDKIKYIDNKICGTITQHQSRGGITNGFKIQSDVSIKVEDKYYLSDKAIEGLMKRENFNKFNPLDENSDAASCITSRANKLSNDNNFIITHYLGGRKGNPKQGGTGHLSKKDGTSYCLDTSNTQAIQKEKKIRRLTPLECWRLQGFKDEDFLKVKGLSDTQLYKQAGNSITVNVMMAIFKKIYEHNN